MLHKEKVVETSSAEKIKKWYQAELEKAQLESNARLETQLREREVQLRERQLKIEKDLLSRRTTQIEQEEKRRLKQGLEKLQIEYDTQSKKFEQKISDIIKKEKSLASERLSKKLLAERDRYRDLLRDRRAQAIAEIEVLRTEILENEELEIKKYRSSLMSDHEKDLKSFTSELKNKELKISEERVSAAKAEEERQFNERIKMALQTLKQESEIRITEAIAKEDTESQLRIKKLIAKEKEIVEMARIESEQKLNDQIKAYRLELDMAAGLESQKRIDMELSCIESAYKANLQNKKISLNEDFSACESAKIEKLTPSSILDSVELSVKKEDPSLGKDLLDDIDINIDDSVDSLDNFIID
jgi:hypothetical protein